MKLLIDENVAYPVIERLRLDGHTLTLVQHVARAQSDVEIQQLAYQMDAIVLTEDIDFGDIVIRQRLSSHGVVLLRLSDMPRTLQPDYVVSALAVHSAEIPDAFTVIQPHAVRIRPLS